MEKKNKLMISIIISVIFLLYVIAYRVFIYPKLMIHSEAISASFAILLFGASSLLLGFRKHNNDKWTTQFIKVVLVSCIFYFICIYAVGLVTGYLNNSYSTEISLLVDNLLFPWVIIIAIELFRYVFIKANRDNMVLVFLITGLIYLFEINFYIKGDSFATFDRTFEFTTSICIPILLKSIMCSYLVYYGDYRSTVLYRILTELYIYVVPLQPNLNSFVTSIANLLLPFSILVVSTKIIEENVLYRSKSKVLFKVLDIPVIILLGFFACVVLGIGPYKLIGIETGSMLPHYHIGDAVVINEDFNIEDIKVDDVIAYENKDGLLIIHRVIKINADNSFITKGDANNTPDSLYVTKEKVRGVVKFKIPFIAYPALFFK